MNATPKPTPTNRLYYGDNLEILQNHEYFPNECVDLIYLDPPFNSSRDYNVLFKEPSGKESEAQITAFKDTWYWGQKAENTYHELIINAPERVSRTMEALRMIVGTNQMMAYLVMMTARFVELYRVLKPTGSLYLHCDPTASHYLKAILDTIFGVENFRNEIIWKRTGAHSGTKGWGPIHDTLLFYTKTTGYMWNKQYQEYTTEYKKNFYRFEDEKGRYRLVTLSAEGTRKGQSGEPWRNINPTSVGRHWAIPKKVLEDLLGEEKAKSLSTQDKLDILDKHGLIYWPPKGSVPQFKRYIDEAPGTHIQDVINDIQPISSQARERLGYPTQKPLALLERIIQASSKPGDMVLDPFCGCGTAIAAAQKLGRTWAGIDITHLAIALMKYRLRDMFSVTPDQAYQVVGESKDLSGAQQLAQENRYQFQYWALSLIQAKPVGGDIGGRTGKKGSDRGIDGVINFIEMGGKSQRVVVQVKSGKVKSGDIRDLVGTVEREKAAIGVFITLENPSRDMIAEAVSAGYFHSQTWGRDYPKLQILTIAELLEGKQIEMPYAWGTFKQAERITPTDDQPQTLDMFKTSP